MRLQKSSGCACIRLVDRRSQSGGTGGGWRQVSSEDVGGRPYYGEEGGKGFHGIARDKVSEKAAITFEGCWRRLEEKYKHVIPLCLHAARPRCERLCGWKTGRSGGLHRKRHGGDGLQGLLGAIWQAGRGGGWGVGSEQDERGRGGQHEVGGTAVGSGMAIGD